ncbi:MAG TPA: amidohydrolase, partial [Acidobacteria bacterium]|nr:amidohydrolase [Acidobacteriota bacterium]
MRVLLLTLFCLTLTAQDIAVRAEKLYTVSGAMITDGVIIIQKGKITAVGKASDIQVPEGMKVLRHKVAVPGLIDGHSTVGFSGLLNQPHDQDQVERSAPMQPELRAIDAYNPKDPLVRFLSNRGITTVHTGHGPGALISGQTLIAKTFGNTIDETVMVPEAMIAATLGDSIRNTEGKAPGTRSKAMAMLRSELLATQDFMKKRRVAKSGQEPDRSLRMEALIQVLRRERPLLITAQKSIDIMGALRLAKEFNIQLVLDGASDAHLLIQEIKTSGVSVIIHPLMTYPRGEMENMNLETPSLLQKAGIPFIFQSGYEAYVPKTRVVLWEAGMAAGNGLSFDQTL